MWFGSGMWVCAVCALLVPQGEAQTRAQADADMSLPSWRFGPVVAGGFAPSYQIRSLLLYTEDVRFFQGGFVVGRTLTTEHGPGLLRGRAEALMEMMPFWLVHEPRQVDTITFSFAPNEQASATFAGYTEHGAAATPVLARWNFVQHVGQRAIPWVEGGAGLLWTTKRFPQGFTYAPGGNTNRLNFTPRVGVGTSLFVRKRASVDIGASLTNVNSAGLGEYNPGVTVLHFTLGYSWHR